MQENERKTYIAQERYAINVYKVMRSYRDNAYELFENVGCCILLNKKWEANKAGLQNKSKYVAVSLT